MNSPPPEGLSFRVPPNAIESEESVLSACIVFPESLIEALEILQPSHFYKKAHEKIFQAMVDLHAKNEPVDLVTLSNRLKQKAQLDETGGATYLARLIDTVPVAVNVSHYANIIRDKAILRITIQKSSDIISKCYDDSEDAATIIDTAQKEILSIEIEDPDDKSYSTISEIAGKGLDTLDERCKHPGRITGVSTGFRQLDMLTWGLQPSDLIIIAARPSQGKTALAISIAGHAAIEENIPVAIFSLEMSKEQLLFRILSDRAKVDGQKFRSGTFNGDDWQRISDVANEISEAPIYIDDNAGLHINQIVRRSRRMWKKHGIGLIVMDYVQLAHGEGGNREQEVSGVVNGLKGLAKELNIPVVALSQLNRDLEKRSNKRPMMSDLRESGCLSGDTLIYNKKYKSFQRMGDIEGSVIGKTDSNHRINGSVISKAKKCFSTGNKQFYKLTLSTGHEIEATANHRFLTLGRKWIRLDELKVGGLVGIPLNFQHTNKKSMAKNEIKMLALFTGNGCCLPRRSLEYTSNMKDLDICNEIQEIANSLYAGQLRTYMKPQKSQATSVFFPAIRKVSRKYRNPLVVLFEKYGLYGKTHEKKTIPGIIFSQTKGLKRLFVKYLWATDGTVGYSERKGRKIINISYSSSSIDLIKQLQILLQSIGIVSIVTKATKDNKFTWYILTVRSQYFIKKFLHEIGIAGYRKGSIASLCLKKTKNITPGWTKYKLSEDEDIAYVTIKKIEKIGIKKSYDIEVEETNNFFANGIIVHNSLEQTADIVSFIYRDEVYNKDENNPERGLAEIIVAKQRNGPIGTVKLSFVDRYASFYPIDNMHERER